MSKVKAMSIALGLAVMLTPVQASSAEILDASMEDEIYTQTKEEVEFVSTIAEMAIEEQKKWVEVDIHITYYTGLICENTHHGSVDAQGGSLKYGTIAIPRNIPLGTIFQIDGFDTEFVGRDRGSKKYIKWIDENTMKIDMYIPPKKNESDSAYYNRVNAMGITKTKGKYLIKE